MPAPLRVAVGSGVAIFVLGAIFWAGATYDRIGEIEKQLVSVDSRLGLLEVVPVLQRDQSDHERRIQKLEDYLRKNP